MHQKLRFSYRISGRGIFPGKWQQHQWRSLRKYSKGNQSNHTDVVATNIAITEQAKLGRLDIARSLFDEMPQRTGVSWNAMVSGYSRWGRYGEALDLTHMMHCAGVSFTEATFSCILSVCANSLSFLHGKQIHGLVLKSGSESFDFVGSSLLYFYASCFKVAEAMRIFNELHWRNELLWNMMLVGYVKCNLMDEAWELFRKMPKRDVVAWTTMISGYSKNEGQCRRALELFRRIRETGQMIPNEFTFDSVIRACRRLGDLQAGRIVHGILFKHGFQSDDLICGALIEFYCECEAIDDAKTVYQLTDNPCLNSSNSLLNSLIMKEQLDDAEKIFNELDEVNAVSCNLMIKGYALHGQVEDSINLFEKMPHRTITSSNTMISIYFRNREINKAVKLFEETMEERNPVTWNSVISGYIQNEKFEEAFGLYVEMHRRQIERTRSTFSVLLHACSCLGSLLQGQLFHAHLAKTPFESNVYVGTSLIDMYSKCGSIINAQKSFTSISSPNVAAWTALINGYAQHGLELEAISLFESMSEQKVQPNGATFVAVLSGCVHAGLVLEGLKLFHLMEKSYGVKPSVAHYACVVDLLGRAGRLQEVEDFVKQMPIEADGVVYGALLSACWLWRHTEMAKRVAEKMLSLELKPASAYVILSNMYADSGNWEEKMNMRNRLRCLDMKKDPGNGWIELNGKVHIFSADDRVRLDCNVINGTTVEHLTANLENCLTQLESDCILVQNSHYMDTV